MRQAAIEYTAADDKYFNYCWWPYHPVAKTEGKLRPVSLLFHSFHLAQINERAYELVQQIRTAIGMFRTVWGTKQVNGQTQWEFYFYDYQRRERDVSITRVLDAIRPIVRCDLQPNEEIPYFMFSLDVDDQLISGRRSLDDIQVYIGNPGSTVSSGIAYEQRAHQLSLKNLYFFFDAKRQLRQVAEKIGCSAHLTTGNSNIDQILHPALRACHTICIANKEGCDTIYFSGVDVSQLSFFLDQFSYPTETREWVAQHRSELDHLLFDVGFDYYADEHGLHVVKSGYYGVF
ncbi:MAG: hypothetical protein GY768_16655 [Planctomycetaceae bacterium]|nr:hypothetical protein [Planctomycetaceae bacterium]